MKYCQECGTALIIKELEHEGMVPFCPKCNDYRFPMYNVAVSMIVISEANHRVLLIKQYGRDYFRLVAGYVNRGETVEHAAIRELKEETGLTAARLRFNRTAFFEPSNTLMVNFTVFVKDGSDMNPNYEIDAYEWFEPDETLRHMKSETLAERFVRAFFEEEDQNGQEK